MPSLADHQSNSYVKLLAVGSAKTGKTGSLASLVKAGYKLRILDLDNLLDILKYIIQKECPELIDNVEYRPIRDKYKSTEIGPTIVGKPRAWIEALKLCTHWKYDGVDLGEPSTWGPDCILVIDSLSRLCDAALDFHEVATPRTKQGNFDSLAVYRNAQEAVEKFLAMLTSTSMETNIIVTAHVSFQEQPDGSLKGFPQGVGQKLSPKIPQYFSSVILYSNNNNKRVFHTTSTRLMDLATPAPFAIEATYPIETGLAEFFAALRDPPAKKTSNVVIPKNFDVNVRVKDIPVTRPNLNQTQRRI